MWRGNDGARGGAQQSSEAGSSARHVIASVEAHLGAEVVEMASRTLTEFLQHSRQVLPELDEGEVVLRRRQGDDVVMLSRPHWEAILDSVRLLAEARQVQAQANRGPVTSPPAWLSLPWLALLEPEDRDACIQELASTALAAVESGRLRPLAEALEVWRATALAVWDARRAADRLGYADEAPVPLPRP